MIKAITAAAVLSLVMCSTVSAGTVSSVPGMKAAAASEAVQVKGRSHARSGGGGRRYAGRRGGRGGRGGGYGYGGGWGGPGICTWVGPLWVCP